DGEAVSDIHAGRVAPVPMNIRNAPTGLMKRLGYGKGYQHAHEYEEGVTDQDLLPSELEGRVYYRPIEEGYEKTIKERMAHREELRRTGARKRGAKERGSKHAKEREHEEKQ